MPEEKEEKLESGIYLPGLRKDIPNFGIVAQSGIESVPKGVKIWYRMWAGEDIDFEGKKYKAVHAKDLLAYEIPS